MYTQDDQLQPHSNHDLGQTNKSQPSSSRPATGTVTLGVAPGIHARLARELAEVAGRFQSTATLHDQQGRGADVRSLLQVLLLEARHGDALMLRCAGTDADEAFAAIAAVLTRRAVGQ